MFKKIALALVVLVAAFCGYVATRPSTFQIERHATIKAPPDVVYAQVADFHQWPSWSPWEKLDPTMKKTYSGAPSGQGASYAWAGNDKTGEGNMTITAAQPNEKIVIRLEFIKPWKAVNTTTFTFKPADGGTVVTWSMSGENNFVGKAMSVFMDMDKLVGDDFEKGLAAMGTSAEGEAKHRAEEAAKAAAAAAPTDGGTPTNAPDGGVK